MRWRYLKDSTGTPLLQSLTEFINDGKLILGICNGFQLLVKLGVLPALDNNRFRPLRRPLGASAAQPQEPLCLHQGPAHDGHARASRRGQAHRP